MTLRRRGPLSAGAIAVVLATSLAACGSSGTKTTTSANATTSATTTAATTPATTTPTQATTTANNGIADKSADQILAAAIAAAKGASAVHVAGATGNVRLDLRLVRGKGASGTISQGANDFKIISVGPSIFLKGSAAFYRQVGGAGAAQLLRDRWLKVPATGRDFASFAALTDMDTLVDQALKPDGRTISKGAVATVDGQQVVPLASDRRKGTLYVLAGGQPYPLEIVQNGGSGRITFDGWDKPVTVTAPTDAVDVASLKTSQSG
ncbi:MAG: hypothetical protein JWQ48_1315 [Conexibacter sp.]|nr:hypothetical protein [Conexibacter sp.]